MNKYLVVKIDPATKFLCRNKMKMCRFAITYMYHSSCYLFKEEINDYKRLKQCFDSETEINKKDLYLI